MGHFASRGPDESSNLTPTVSIIYTKVPIVGPKKTLRARRDTRVYLPLVYPVGPVISPQESLMVVSSRGTPVYTCSFVQSVQASPVPEAHLLTRSLLGGHPPTSTVTCNVPRVVSPFSYEIHRCCSESSPSHRFIGPRESSSWTPPSDFTGDRYDEQVFLLAIARIGEELLHGVLPMKGGVSVGSFIS